MNISLKKIGTLIIFIVSISILSGWGLFEPQATITSIEVDAATLAESYDIDTFELSSINIKVTYSDGKFRLIPITEAMLSSEDQALLSTVGEHIITINYEGFTKIITLNLSTKLTSKKYVYFGSFPQTVVADSNLISSLNSLTSTNTKGYYEYEGCEYMKAKATPYSNIYQFMNGETIKYGTTYYFKVEPIKWRVLEEVDDTYTLLSEYIIDKQIFDNSSNNYENSIMREWLNNVFYNLSFSTLEKTSILTTVVDNSASTTISSSNPNACNNTNDKVYLLSYQEAISSTYGFTLNSARTSFTTDLVRAIGVYMAIDSKYYANGNWWLRSPYLFYEFQSMNIDDYGSIQPFNPVYTAAIGARPAIRIIASKYNQ
ncbi:MAG: DUF6273 domain-containing protein [Bacilli bacterium]|nr:DUF6273 domain-containing protein [Bacilli bacterium]MDD2681550.1 DUF6273 domain-containing protein [Bacilli bacterium]MDD3121187.1 DUF6273 domain-containing protein [Bacilli bacterium]MDD4482569.1 DUF6273 domain-containing protein [Bacilli bacterium]